MADKMVQFTDKDGNNIYPVSKLPGNAIVAEDLVQLTTTDLENLTNLITPILLSKVYPIGSIFISTNSTNPGAYLGGTWEAWGTGRTIVGIDTKDTNFNTVEKTGGEITHTLTINETPSHNHTYNAFLRANAGDGGLWVGNNQYFIAIRSRVNNGDSIPNNGSSTWNNENIGHDYNLQEKMTYTGGSQAHNNLQPYITCYMWKRTA